MNMSTLLSFGVSVEKMYGTAFYAMLHFWLMIISNSLTLAWSWFMVNVVPMKYHGGPDNYLQCGVGYSNILFGIVLVFAYKGDRYVNFFGLCKFEKKYVPWFYLLAIYLTIPESSLAGHFFGILAGLLIKFGGLYFLLPRYQWLSDFDYIYEAYIRAHKYFKA